MDPSAKIIADSVSENGHRVTTFEIVIHRFVLSEFNTHRVLSRNSASSRAIPVAKQIARIQESPMIPLSFPAEQSGMQGGDELSPELVEEARGIWVEAAEDAVLFADLLMHKGVHKSVINRLLEPFMAHTIVCTASSWANFFALRVNPMAQPEIRAVAQLMKDCYDSQTPDKVLSGEWHLPYIYAEDRAELGPVDLVKVSSARCARVSYLTHDGKRDHSKDLELYDRLASADPMHSSPFEHVATPMSGNSHTVVVGSSFSGKRFPLTLPKYGNLLGWQSHRYDVEADLGYQSYS